MAQGGLLNLLLPFSARIGAVFLQVSSNVRHTNVRGNLVCSCEWLFSVSPTPPCRALTAYTHTHTLGCAMSVCRPCATSQECLREWLAMSKTCPLCRANLDIEEPATQAPELLAQLGGLCSTAC